MNSLASLLGWRYSFGAGRSKLLSFLSRVSTLGLALGVAVLILVLSVMNGFERELKQRILNLVPQVTLVNYAGFTDWQASAELINKHPQVDGVAPFVQINGLLLVKGRAEPALIFGIDPQFESHVSDIARFLDDFPNCFEPGNSVVIGAGLAQSLGLVKGSALQLVVPGAGERARAEVKSLRVTGILQSGTELDNSIALMRLDTALSLTPGGLIQRLRVKVNDLFAARRIAWQLQSQLPLVDYVSDWSHSHGNLYSAVNMSRNMVSLLLFSVIAIAVMNVVTALVIGVVDKRGEIAILRTMGASQGLVRRAFIMQGMIIGAVGTGLGLLVGCLLSLSAPALFEALQALSGTALLNTHVYPINYLPSDLRLGNVVSVAVISLLLTLLATLLSSGQAARQKPATVLRYE